MLSEPILESAPCPGRKTEMTSTKTKATTNIRCGMGHSGSHKLTHAGTYFECDGCGKLYTAAQVAQAKGRPGEVGSDQLFDRAAQR